MGGKWRWVENKLRRRSYVVAGGWGEREGGAAAAAVS